jgi:LuxR family transcriptional regulator, maltose regulon positive regulatory protein
MGDLQGSRSQERRVSLGGASETRLQVADVPLNAGRSPGARGPLEVSAGPAGAGLEGRGAQAPPGIVRRPELFDRLTGDRAGGVILVRAPAGSGKTVLLRSWIAAVGLEERAAWVSVERGERDAQRFWLSVIDALSDACGIVQRVDAAPRFRGAAVVEQVLGDIASLREPVGS